jgi:hypothetical protein
MQNNTYSPLFAFLIILISINLFILDLKIFSQVSSIKVSDISTYKSPLIETPRSQIAISGVCPQSCTDVINNKISGLPQRTGSTEENSAIQNSQLQAKRSEYYVPLGAGNTTKSAWDDIISTETIIDPSFYGNIKESYFIASLNNPTQNGQVEAQIINVTDKHPVWGSHVIMSGPQTQTITSDKITLDNGNKLYRVQLKSSLGYQVSLDNAKIRIISE